MYLEFLAHHVKEFGNADVKAKTRFILEWHM
jgi:hypothetical protein